MPNILLPMNVHNVFRECDYDLRDNPRHANAVVHEFMVPLINELSLKRPMWTFVSRSSAVTSDNSVWHYARFQVRVGDEIIGEIDMDVNWRTSEKSYEFDCRQLRAKRTRGSSTKTKDLKKATKLITENFRELSYGEHAHKAEQLTKQAAYRVQSSRKYAFSQLEAKARPEVMGFLRKHWSEFVGSILDSKLQSELAGMLDAYDEARAADAINAAIGTKGTFIKLVDGKYVATRYGDNEVHVYTNETLPSDLRGNMGALKLVNKDMVIPDIGVRGDEDSFYLLPMEVTDE